MRIARVGFLVNPVAGLGARVGLKGTDGVVDEALRRGAKPVAPARARAFVDALRSEPEFVTAAGEMGDDVLADAGQSSIVVYTPTGSTTTSEDTRAAAAAFADAGVDLVVFVGGDGTASDVAAGLQGAAVATPALGIPSGSKMYSGVFADTPQAAARVVDGGFDDTRQEEVLDIDEAAFRQGDLRVALKGALHVPADARVQAGKSAGSDDAVEQESLGAAVAESLEPGVTYILGAGTTMMNVKRALGVDGTLLGIDAVRDGKLVAKDAAESDLLALATPLRVLVSPIGAQGFVLGRGNLPISPDVVRRAGGPEGVTVVATPWKLSHIPALKVDTGDPELDAAFPRFVRAVTGFDRTKMVRVQR